MNFNKKNLIISFSGVAKEHMFSEPKKEFQKIQSFDGFDSVFVIDNNLSWFNNINIEHIIKKAKKYENVITIGNSMGGFNAIMFAHIFPVKTVISFVPQYSIHPEIVPWEKRWQPLQQKIIKDYGFKYEKLLFNDNTKYNIIAGEQKEDLKHLALIPNKINIKKIIIEKTDHGVARYLKSKNKLYPLIEQIVQEK